MKTLEQPQSNTLHYSVIAPRVLEALRQRDRKDYINLWLMAAGGLALVLASASLITWIYHRFNPDTDTNRLVIHFIIIFSILLILGLLIAWCFRRQSPGKSAMDSLDIPLNEFFDDFRGLLVSLAALAALSVSTVGSWFIVDAIIRAHARAKMQTPDLAVTSLIVARLPANCNWIEMSSLMDGQSPEEFRKSIAYLILHRWVGVSRNHVWLLPERRRFIYPRKHSTK